MLQRPKWPKKEKAERKLRNLFEKHYYEQEKKIPTRCSNNLFYIRIQHSRHHLLVPHLDEVQKKGESDSKMENTAVHQTVGVRIDAESSI